MNNSLYDLRSILVKDLQNRFLNIFIEKGFSNVALLPDEESPELKRAFPLGRLKRKRNGILELIEVQFDKYDRPRFVVNFGMVPPEGVTLPWGDHLDQEKADVSALSEAFRLYSSPFLMRWFKLGLLTEKSEDSAKRLVDKAIKLSTEIEEWFELKRIGKHMRKFGMGD